MNNQALVVKPPDSALEPRVTREEAEDAAKDAGLAVIRVKKLEAAAKIGGFIDQLGAKKIGRSTIVLAQESIETAIAQCDQALAQLDGADDPGPAIEIIRLKTALTAQLLQAGNSMVKSEEVSQAEQTAPAMRIPFPAGTKVAVVAPEKVEPH